MSDKTWKQYRRRIKPIYKKWELAAKAGMRIPWYIRFAGLFSKPIKDRWINKWTRENRRIMRGAMKKLSHELEGEK